MCLTSSEYYYSFDLSLNSWVVTLAMEHFWGPREHIEFPLRSPSISEWFRHEEGATPQQFQGQGVRGESSSSPVERDLLIL